MNNMSTLPRFAHAQLRQYGYETWLLFMTYRRELKGLLDRKARQSRLYKVCKVLKSSFNSREPTGSYHRIRRPYGVTKAHKSGPRQAVTLPRDHHRSLQPGKRVDRAVTHHSSVPGEFRQKQKYAFDPAWEGGSTLIWHPPTYAPCRERLLVHDAQVLTSRTSSSDNVKPHPTQSHCSTGYMESLNQMYPPHTDHMERSRRIRDLLEPIPVLRDEPGNLREALSYTSTPEMPFLIRQIEKQKARHKFGVSYQWLEVRRREAPEIVWPHVATQGKTTNFPNIGTSFAGLTISAGLENPQGGVGESTKGNYKDFKHLIEVTKQGSDIAPAKPPSILEDNGKPNFKSFKDLLSTTKQDAKMAQPTIPSVLQSSATGIQNPPIRFAVTAHDLPAITSNAQLPIRDNVVATVAQPLTYTDENAADTTRVNTNKDDVRHRVLAEMQEKKPDMQLSLPMLQAGGYGELFKDAFSSTRTALSRLKKLGGGEREFLKLDDQPDLRKAFKKLQESFKRAKRSDEKEIYGYLKIIDKFWEPSSTN